MVNRAGTWDSVSALPAEAALPIRVQWVTRGSLGVQFAEQRQIEETASQASAAGISDSRPQARDESGSANNARDGDIAASSSGDAPVSHLFAQTCAPATTFRRIFVMRTALLDVAAGAAFPGRSSFEHEQPRSSVAGHESILLAACAANEQLPQSPDLPADVFSSCLTTPIKVAIFLCPRHVTLSHH